MHYNVINHNNICCSDTTTQSMFAIYIKTDPIEHTESASTTISIFIQDDYTMDWLVANTGNVKADILNYKHDDQYEYK